MDATAAPGFRAPVVVRPTIAWAGLSRTGRFGHHSGMFRCFGVFLLLCLTIASVALAETAPPAPGVAASPPAAAPATATFAGGCFWCMQPAFDAVPGVVRTTVGYTGGTEAEPTYGDVSSGATGHAESIEVTYDPARVTYEKLLDVFWHNVDPTVRDRQFCDLGHQYRTAIFYHDEAQRRAAEASQAALEAAHTVPGPIVTEIVPAGRFWPAEDYHQDYYRKNPVRYGFYRATCGRDARLRELWGAAAGGH
jgi:peptide-methionine (S)-S-oxide reductase